MGAARKPWVGGNWKCNGTVASIKTLAETLNKADFDPNTIDVAICPAALHIPTAQTCLERKFIIATQNVSPKGMGAYTGELSLEMLKDMNITTTLVGHSERRTLYHESDALVAEKTEACQKADIVAVVCIGETLKERESNETHNVLTRQVEAVLPVIKKWSNIVFAYEPVWAIGTGKVATPEQAEEAHQFIRSLIASKVDSGTAASVRIVYGGSVNEKNCEELARQENIDGFLVGGASLKPGFVDIIRSMKA